MISIDRLLDGFAQPAIAVRRRRQQQFAADAVDAAVEYAYHHFSVYYEDWANSLFDRHFLHYHATRTFVAFVAGEVGQRAAAEQLAAAWDRQFGGGETARRRLRRNELAKAVERFLGWLVDYLQQSGGDKLHRDRRPVRFEVVLDKR